MQLGHSPAAQKLLFHALLQSGQQHLCSASNDENHLQGMSWPATHNSSTQQHSNSTQQPRALSCGPTPAHKRALLWGAYHTSIELMCKGINMGKPQDELEPQQCVYTGRPRIPI